MNRIDLIDTVSRVWDETDSPERLRYSLPVLAAIRDAIATEADKAAINTVIEYVAILIAAKLARLDGRIATATRFEARCDDLYHTLPPEWQW
jgi:hypothetical protein